MAYTHIHLWSFTNRRTAATVDSLRVFSSFSFRTFSFLGSFQGQRKTAYRQALALGTPPYWPSYLSV